MKKHKMIWISLITFSMFISILKSYLKEPDTSWRKYWILGAILFIVGAFIVVLIWYLRHRNRMRKINGLLQILKDEKNPDKFIEESKKFLKGIKSDFLAASFHIDICAAYCGKGEFQKAKQELLLVKEESLSGIIRVFYLINLAYVNFYLGETTEALADMKVNQKGLKDFESSPGYGPVIAILRIFEARANDNLLLAQELLSNTKQRWTEEQMQDDLVYLEEKINNQ